VSNGEQTRFWLDPWVYNSPICDNAPMIIQLCENKSIFVAQAMAGNDISFRRWLFGDLRTSWDKVWQDACTV